MVVILGAAVAGDFGVCWTFWYARRGWWAQLLERCPCRRLAAFPRRAVPQRARDSRSRKRKVPHVRIRAMGLSFDVPELAPGGAVCPVVGILGGMPGLEWCQLMG